MKQRITIEQLEELTDIQKNYLREWWKPQRYDWIRNCKGSESVIIYIEEDGRIEDDDCIYDHIGEGLLSLPLLTIGQMIEYLSVSEQPMMEFKDGQWEVFHRGPTFNSVELTDALWEGVKRRLYIQEGAAKFKVSNEKMLTDSIKYCVIVYGKDVVEEITKSGDMKKIEQMINLELTHWNGRIFPAETMKEIIREIREESAED